LKFSWVHIFLGHPVYKKRNNKRNTKQKPKKATELRSHTSSSTADRNFGKYHLYVWAI